MEKEYPSFFEQVKNLTDLAKDVIKDFSEGNEITVSDEVYEKRLKACGECSYYDPTQQRCTSCGCFIPVKAKMSAAECPMIKW